MSHFGKQTTNGFVLFDQYKASDSMCHSELPSLSVPNWEQHFWAHYDNQREQPMPMMLESNIPVWRVPEFDQELHLIKVMTMDSKVLEVHTQKVRTPTDREYIRHFKEHIEKCNYFISTTKAGVRLWERKLFDFHQKNQHKRDYVAPSQSVQRLG